MDVLLMTITVASLLVAVGMALVAWRLAREARERSAARVAALATAIETEGADVSGMQTFEDPSIGSDAGEPSGDLSASGGLFAAPLAERPALARLAPAILAGVVIVGGLVATAVMITGGDGAASAAAAREQRPLELLSLRHEIKDGSLSITGLVRNPVGSQQLERLTAVVFLFDDKGGFLASGRSPLDFTTLSPGEESPFVVTLAAPAGVARYRVSFRRDEGGVIAHLDRREARLP